MVELFNKYLIKPERLKGERIHKIVGDRLFDKAAWHISRQSIAGGLALGLFIAFTPTIPFQMVLSAVCALWLRVNLPIAIGACWVTNPFTAVWVYMMEYRLGQAIMGKLPGIFAISDLESIGAVRRLFSQATCVWTGGVIIGTLFALSGYIAIQMAWRLVPRIKSIEMAAAKVENFHIVQRPVLEEIPVIEPAAALRARRAEGIRQICG